MGDELQKWKGLLKWSMSQTPGNAGAPPRQISDEDRRFFQEAVQANTKDIVQRMREITIVMSMLEEELKQQGVTTEDLIEMLDELQDLVGQIDYANDLHSIGGLVPLLNYLKNPDPELRAKSAEVIHTVVQNNPKSQQNAMDCNGMELLMHNAAQDKNTAARAKALGALGALVRNNRAGLNSFQLGNGFSALRDALSSEDVKLQRKALQLLRSILSESPGASEANRLDQPGMIRTLLWLTKSPDLDVRHMAVAALSDMAGQGKGEASRVAAEPGMKETLAKRVDELTELKGDDLASARDELQTLGDLWSACGYDDQGPRKKALEALSTMLPLNTSVIIGERESKPYARGPSNVKKQEDNKPEDNKPPLLLGAPPRDDQ